MNEEQVREKNAEGRHRWRRRFGYVSMAYLLAVSLACGSSGEDTGAEEEASSPIQIRSATYGTALGAQQQIVSPVTEFAPTDPVCVSIEIEGRPRTGIVTLRWPIGSRNIDAQFDLSDLNGGVFFSVGQNTHVGGTLSHEGMLPPGQHETIVLYEGTEVGRFPYQVATPPPAIRGPFVSAASQPPPTPVNPLPSTTPVIYGSWMHPALPAGEHVTFSLLAVDVGAAAAPMTRISSAEIDATVAGPMHGPLQFSLPQAWPPGSYRIVGAGNTLGQFATLDFVIQ